MLQPEIDWKICKICRPCESSSECNTRAIMRIDMDEPPIIAYERCSRCGACVLACCCEAISMKTMN